LSYGKIKGCHVWGEKGWMEMVADVVDVEKFEKICKIENEF
jgi:hypothetical protein